jgi:HTH-type transcriptional repressor of NAD biosynthesis genes
MIKAFVFGKFLPFHKGHEAMINFALTKCDFLTILICCSNKEKIASAIRLSWLKNTFPEQKNIEFKIFNYREEEFPNTSVSSTIVSKVWSAKFKDLFPGYSLLITSESYGDYVAEFMGIKHIPFDPERKIFPISASQIRADNRSHWKFLPEQVKSYFIKKIVLLGSESTGKTTLTKKLAEEFQATHVLEAAREIIPSSKNFSLEDLYSVAIEHAKKIEAASLIKNPLIIIDTDIHITQSYASYIFNKKLEMSPDIYEVNKGDLYLYLNKDVAFVQDGTRLNEEERNFLDDSHRKILSASNILFHEISGNWEKRYKKSVELIENLLKQIEI